MKASYMRSLAHDQNHLTLRILRSLPWGPYLGLLLGTQQTYWQILPLTFFKTVVWSNRNPIQRSREGRRNVMCLDAPWFFRSFVLIIQQLLVEVHSCIYWMFEVALQSMGVLYQKWMYHLAGHNYLSTYSSQTSKSSMFLSLSPCCLLYFYFAWTYMHNLSYPLVYSNIHPLSPTLVSIPIFLYTSYSVSPNTQDCFAPSYVISLITNTILSISHFQWRLLEWIKLGMTFRSNGAYCSKCITVHLKCFYPKGKKKSLVRMIHEVMDKALPEARSPAIHWTDTVLLLVQEMIGKKLLNIHFDSGKN